MIRIISIAFFSACACGVWSQDKGVFTGQLQLGANAFIKDERIGAANTPQYESEKFGADAWLDLNYKIKGFDFGIRGDLFINSNLLNPTDSYSDEGIGRWHIRKRWKSLYLQVGYIYDQIGSGLIFRSYEQRPLLIDNALRGGSIEYQLGSNLTLKAFGGRQKNLFSTYSSIIKGASIEGFVSLGSEKAISLVPGFGIIDRTWSNKQVDDLISTLQNYTPKDSIGFFHHSYAFTFYNTLSIGPIAWYSEAAFKKRGIFFDADADRLLYTGDNTLGKFRNEDGSVLYNSISYGVKGFGATLEHKRTKNFTFRADPFTTLNRGLINFLPPMTRVNSFRLKSRYVPAAREISENAWQLELRYTLSKKWKLEQYFSTISDLSGQLLYRELDHEFHLRRSSRQLYTFGLQLQRYNQAIYEGKSGVPMVKTWIPYFEILRKFKKRRTLRIEAQYMNSQEDFGSWTFALVEYTLAPKWSFALSDMYNIKPKKTEKIHYPRADITFVHKATRLALSYVKQVEGVVCAGGICRLEPAFSGVKLGLSSTF
ncbi:MAG: hypothetical protein HKN87_07880 [Saprospiraceae bacterium]|nr:hypothetical protein [Saprospiraceae bacterium]